MSYAMCLHNSLDVMCEEEIYDVNGGKSYSFTYSGSEARNYVYNEGWKVFGSMVTFVMSALVGLCSSITIIGAIAGVAECYASVFCGTIALSNFIAGMISINQTGNVSGKNYYIFGKLIASLVSA